MDPRKHSPSRLNMPLTVSIIITTKNRVHELRRTCAVLKQLVPAPLEILITADGCADDTVTFVQTGMPSTRLFINEEGKGSIASRDHMIRAAQGDLILSLDDDSYPQEPDCLATIAALFAQRPQMAVLHFPQCTDEYPETLPRFDFGAARATRSFSSAGAVLRRATYLQLPGFEPTFFHAYEEPDYSLQCVASGLEVFYHPGVSIRHHYTRVARNECRTHHRHARNEFWSTLLRCPLPQLFLLAPYRAISQFRYAVSRGLGWVIREPAWWMQAIAGIPRQLARRQPVTWADYRRWLALTDIAYPPLPSRGSPMETDAVAKPRIA